ncbi:FadR/GntR family transcriptional regulator [Actinomadura sp. 1N219]|uniref:FadR/GntR family transcriptional regulator n=1 Tax=Actinomadura sp. 1N219 TaxID=3375152 RepID=UPI00378CDA13
MSHGEPRLEPLRSEPIKERVIRELSRQIEEGAFQPGDQLPNERNMSEQLKVSRGTVREALQFLQTLGLVEIRHGVGTFVRSAGDSRPLRTEWRQWTARHADQVHDMLEVRKGLESFAAELAAQRATEADLAALDEAFARMEAAFHDRDLIAMVQADVEFHRALIAGAHNEALLELANTMGEQLLPERGATWDLPERPEKSITEHRAIRDAIRSRRGELARWHVIAHLESVEQDIAGSLAPDNRPTPVPDPTPPPP